MAMPESVVSSKGIGSAASYIISQFLSDKHCYSLLTALSTHYSAWKPIATVKKVMESYGVTLNEEDDEALLLMEVERPLDTNKIIDFLTKKLPQSITKEELKRFVLQCQLVLSTSTRLEKALSEGSCKGIEEVLNDANEVTGIMPNILKMSVAQAGKESNHIIKHHDDWSQKNSERLWQLLENLEGSNQMHKELYAAQTQLLQHSHVHKEKARKAMVTLCGKNSEALQVCVYGEWKSLVAQLKVEREIRTEYQDRLDHMDKEMIKMKMEKMENMKRMFLRSVAGDNLTIMSECLNGMRTAVKMAKQEAETARKIAEGEEKLAAYAREQLKSANSFMNRMNASCDTNLMTTHFREWATVVAEVKAQQAADEQAKLDEKAAADALAAKSDEAKKLIQRMTVAFGSAVVETTFKVWKQDIEQEKRDKAAAALFQENQDKIAAFFAKGKQGAVCAYSSMADVGIFCAMSHAFLLWNQVIRVDRLVFLYERKCERLYKQLSQLQGAFHGFEHQINTIGSLDRADSGDNLGQWHQNSVPAAVSPMAGPPARALLRSDGVYGEPSSDPSGYPTAYAPPPVAEPPMYAAPPQAQRPAARTYRAAEPDQYSYQAQPPPRGYGEDTELRNVMGSFDRSQGFADRLLQAFREADRGAASYMMVERDFLVYVMRGVCGGSLRTDQVSVLLSGFSNENEVNVLDFVRWLCPGAVVN